HQLPFRVRDNVRTAGEGTPPPVAGHLEPAGERLARAPENTTLEDVPVSAAGPRRRTRGNSQTGIVGGGLAQLKRLASRSPPHFPSAARRRATSTPSDVGGRPGGPPPLAFRRCGTDVRDRARAKVPRLGRRLASRLACACITFAGAACPADMRQPSAIASTFWAPLRPSPLFSGPCEWLPLRTAGAGWAMNGRHYARWRRHCSTADLQAPTGWSPFFICRCAARMPVRSSVRTPHSLCFPFA
ncbi:hypothetical protein BDY21DRAFT_398391, partial [Lineolata rhizophorae]